MWALHSNARLIFALGSFCTLTVSGNVLTLKSTLGMQREQEQQAQVENKQIGRLKELQLA